MRRLNKEELLRLTNIFDNAGQVFLAGFIVGPLFQPLDSSSFILVELVGILLTLSCWIISIRLTSLIKRI
jgi:hypothetical protein